MTLALDSMPLGKPLRQEASRDDLVKRGFMVVIGLYLIVALGAPLFVMLSKSLSTYRFDLAAFEFQVSDDTGGNWSAPVTAADLNARLNAVADVDLTTNSDGRLAATKFFPDFKFRSPVHYRLRATGEGASYLVGTQLQKGSDWQDYDSGTFRRIVLPQAMRVIIPPVGNEVISMVKLTSVASVIQFSEILRNAQTIYYANARVIELLIVAAGWYLIVVTLLQIGQYFLERHFSKGRGERRAQRAATTEEEPA